MSSPRDRDGADDGGEWQEPSHLSGDDPDGTGPGTTGEADGEPDVADRRRTPRDGDHTAEGATWQPPGWDLPAVTPDREQSGAYRDPDAGPARDPHAGVDPAWAPPTGPPPEQPTAPGGPGGRGGVFGTRRRGPNDVEKVFRDEGDVVGAQGWALQQGWTISDGTGPEDAVLRELVTSAPIRATKDHRPASVLRGRSGRLDLVAFDVVFASGRYFVPQYAVTAAPLLGAVPRFRLSPARLWKHRTGGLVPIASGNEAFDTRWMLLAAEDGPQVRRLAQDPSVHRLLLGSDDGDEFWTTAGHGDGWAGGFVAAVRPDGHRPQLLEHHARLLSAVVAALGAGS